MIPFLSFIFIERLFFVSSVQSLSQVLTLCDPKGCSTPGFLSITSFRSLLKLMSIESVMPSNHLILCHPLIIQPSIFPSIRVFSNESLLRIRLNLLGVQGTLKSLLQHHSSKALILQHLVFFIVQLSHPYMTTGKNIPLTRCTFLGKVMSVF